MPNYYGTATTNAKEAASNTIVANSTDSSYSVQLTTGTKDKMIIDICGASASAALSDASCIRVRCIINDGELNGYGKFTTEAFQYGDVSSVTGDIGLTSANEGKAMAGMENLPFTFRTLENSSISGRAIRIVLKAPGIKNGDKVSVFVDASNNADKAAWVNGGFGNTGADVKFTQASATAPRALINAGPSGTGDAAGIPDFSARLLKKPNTTSDALLEISSAVSLFSAGGEGIGLKKLSFALSKQNIDGLPGGNDIYFSHDATDEKVVDGVYVYTSTVTGGASNAYYLQCIRVADDFDKSALVEQFPVPNELLLVNNQPVNPAATGSLISVDGDNETGPGDKAEVSFKGAGAPEGYETIERYSAYYASRDQIDAMPRKSVNLADFKAHVPLQVAHIYRADISYAAQDSTQKIPITQYLSNTTPNDAGSRYSVIVTAATLKNGVYLESNNTTDISATRMSTSTNDASMGFRVSGTPDAASNVSIKTGASILTTAEKTNNDAMFDVMDNNLDVIYFDDVDQNGIDYNELRYVIIRASDVQYVGAKDFPDASYTTATGSFSGTSNGQTLTIDATAGNGVTQYYANNKWNAATNGIKDASNGSQFALKFALRNTNGVGSKSDWIYFTPSTTPNAKDALYSYDPSGDDAKSYFGNMTNATSWTSFELLQSDATTDARAASQGLVVSSTGIDFKWGLKNKTEKAKGDAGAVKESLSGGSDITSSRFTVVPAANHTNETAAMRTARIYGQSQKDIDSTKSGAFAQVGSPDRIFASECKDANDNTVSMKMGQRYNIEAQLVNANGFNTEQPFKVTGFAPMGTLPAPKNVRQGTAVPVLLSDFKARVDISFDDMSGAELGGHLLTAYDVKMTQNVNGDLKTIRDFTTTSGSKPLDGSNNGIINNASTLGRKLVVDSTSVATAGFPITVTLRAEANAKAFDSTANNNNAAEAANQAYNKNRANVTSETVITVAGPAMASGSEHDEVQGLNVVTGDKHLKIEWAEPQNASVKDSNKQNGNDPRVLNYQVTTWDISQTTIASTGSDVLAVRKHEKTIAPEAGKSVYEFTQDGLVNGCAYLVQVQTKWGYGPAFTQPFTTVGVYSSLATRGSITDIPLAVTGGYKWFAPGSNANNLTNAIQGMSAAGSNGAKVYLPVTNANYHVPSAKPTIENDRANKVLKIRDNGNALNNGALIQVSPTPTNSGTSIFNINLLAKSGSPLAPTHYTTAAAFKDNIDLTYTIKASTLGADWAKERNIIIAENDNGAVWEIQEDV